MAAQEGHLDVIRLLLEHGADPFLMTGSKRTALHIAVNKERAEVVKLLASRMKTLQDATVQGQSTVQTPLSIQSPAETPPAVRTPPHETELSDTGLSVSIDRDSDSVEELLCCPITKSLMQDPVVAADGHTYEREAITAWLRSHGKSPVTQQPMSISSLVPNLIVKHQIEVHSRENTPEESLS